MTVHDRIGVFASLAGHMAENGISLASIVQHGISNGDGDEPRPLSRDA
jgi:homoserine dehydrogenase